MKDKNKMGKNNADRRARLLQPVGKGYNKWILINFFNANYLTKRKLSPIKNS